MGDYELQPPLKSKLDKKEYRVIRLPSNNLLALLVSDPDQRKGRQQSYSACALRINVGYFSDPEKLYGLAQLLERVITARNKKYKKENEYKMFVHNNRGEADSTTAAESTLFYFKIPGNLLAEAMKMFAAHFANSYICQLAMQKESKAMELECSEYLKLESSRRNQLLAGLTAPGHPCRAFACGDWKICKEEINENLQKSLDEFRMNHYSAHRMFLSVQSHLSLDELQTMVTTSFKDIPCNNSPDPKFTDFNYENSFTEEFYSNVFYVNSDSGQSKLEINWCLPPFIKEYLSKPHLYVAHILNYGGPGSIGAYLKNRFWATSVKAGFDSDFGYNSIFSLLKFRIYLTDEGLNHIEEILEAIFSFVKLLKKCGPKEEIFTELKYINDVHFQFYAEPNIVDNVVQLTDSLMHYPSEDILTGPTMLMKYDEKAIGNVIDMINNGKFNIMIESIKEFSNIAYKKMENCRQTKYASVKFPKEWISLWENPRIVPELYMPRENLFLPEDLTILWKEGMPKSEPYPKKIVDTDVCKAWFKQDDKFLLPVAYMNFHLISPLPRENIQTFVLNMIYCLMIKFQLRQHLFSAIVAGLSFEINYARDGITLMVNWYNDKLHHIVDIITKHMTLLVETLNEQLFKVFQEKLQREMYTFLSNPSNLNSNIRRCVVTEGEWMFNEKYNAVAKVTLDDMKNFLSRIFVEMKIQCLFQGNLSEKTAQQVAKSIVNNFKCSAIANVEKLESKIYQVPRGENCIKCQSIDNSGITALTNFYQVGPSTLQSGCMLLLFGTLTQEALAVELRDVQYPVDNIEFNLEIDHGILGYTITANLRGEITASVVEQQIESVRHKIIGMLQTVESKELKEIQQLVFDDILAKDNVLADEVNRNWSEIIQNEYLFDREIKEMEYLKNITKNDINKFFEKMDKELRKLSILIIGNAKRTPISRDYPNEIHLDFIEDGTSICNVDEFKTKLRVYPVEKNSTEMGIETE